MQHLCGLLLMLEALVFLHLAGTVRFGVVAQTVYYAGTQLIQFASVFVVTLLVYSVAGHCLFGGDMREFGSMYRSFETCFEICLGHSEHYDEMLHVTASDDEIVNPTMVFFWSLVAVGLILAMKILVTILMNGFGKAQEIESKAEPILSTLQSVLEAVSQVFTPRKNSPRKVPDERSSAPAELPASAQDGGGAGLDHDVLRTPVRMPSAPATMETTAALASGGEGSLGPPRVRREAADVQMARDIQELREEMREMKAMIARIVARY
jgi:hypothetical protein|eukprot:COSAG06_NODE_7782_length_2378_cov_1.759386_2_plen_266_part_00